MHAGGGGLIPGDGEGGDAQIDGSAAFPRNAWGPIP